MGNLYELRLFDITLITFSLIKGEWGGLTSEIISFGESRNLLPLDLTPDNVGLPIWLEHRTIPKNREFVEEILKSLGLSMGDTKGIIDVCKGLSLNDSYWVVPAGFEGRFADYNLYENRFSEILSLVAYTGVTQGDISFTTSPELTTNGMLPKAWRYIDGDGIYLYKGGTSGFVNTGNEPYSEYYASQIADVMGISAVHYDLENWKGILASKCKLFTSINTAYVPIGRIVKSGGLDAVMRYYNEHGVEFINKIRDMLVFDAVIYNTDRHFGNFGVLRNNHSGNVVAPAPLFDHGMSLFNFAMDEDILNLDQYAKTRFPANGATTFEENCIKAMSTRQADKLRSLFGFKFIRHPKLNLSEVRLMAIERHIQKRAGYLLSLRKR
ncbi:MAG: hypothetical protein LBS29_04595 [Endomicrobium sp.]|nr:hypothetical protein [Endomicrobium sp.]